MRSTRLAAALLVLSALCAVSAPAAMATAPEWREAHRRWEVADKLLNLAYQRALGALSPAARKRLTEAQLQWIRFRDAEVRFHEDRMRGGSGASALAEQAKAALTETRVRDLEGVWEANGRLQAHEEEDLVVKPDPKKELQEARADLAKADRELNARYRLVVAGLDAPARALLARAEQEWIALRDRDAALEASLDPRPAFSIARRERSLAVSTQARIDQLDALLAAWRARR
jgi:uncharacterized protein YecT (DUF1311 family)